MLLDRGIHFRYKEIHFSEVFLYKSEFRMPTKFDITELSEGEVRSVIFSITMVLALDILVCV